jgi:hypothetical protein
MCPGRVSKFDSGSKESVALPSASQPRTGVTSVGVGVTRIPGGHVLVSFLAAAARDGGFAAAFAQALNQPRGDVLVDLAGVESCDRDVADALIGCHDELAAAGRRLVLVNVGFAVRRQLAAFAGVDHHEPKPDPAG